MINVLRFLNSKKEFLKPLVIIFCLIPGINLAYRFQTDQLDTNGLEDLLHTTGYWAMALFILTLAITPLRRVCSYMMILSKEQYGKRLSDWNWMIKLRRAIGVISFLYAACHFYIFYYYELDSEFSELIYETDERPFIFMGLAALILLVPLFLTSTNASMKLLKRNWRRLHRLMYPIAIAIAFHYLWLTKPGVYDAYPYAFLIAFLLIFRLLAHYKLLFKRNDDGMESER